MRLLYVDIDTLRADHLGGYGYHRSTSPYFGGAPLNAWERVAPKNSPQWRCGGFLIHSFDCEIPV